MCGIAGLLDRRGSLGADEKRAVVQRLNGLQHHRGPDADGLWAAPDGRCVLGHRRLAVIDLDARSNQPMTERSGRYALTFNGEIYNFQALRAELEALGAQFRTQSDTEVLIEGYARWGNRLFARLDGMFALAVYDTQSGALVLARDRLGEKPLYVARSDGIVAFASELKPLLTLPSVSLEVSLASLYEYLALRYVADPHTLYQSVSSVQPGTFRIVRGDGSESERSYYAFDLPSDRGHVDDEAYLGELEAALTEAIQTRLIADVPVGAFLSSGVDSSLVCAIAAQVLGKDLRCFSAGFEGGEENETPAARKIAHTLGLRYEEYSVSQNDLLETASHFGAILDEPNGDRSCVPVYFLARLVREQVTVALSGDGGDELFGGYGRYRAYRSDPQGSDLDAVLAYFAKGLPVFPADALREAFPEEDRVFRQRVAARFVAAFARKELDDIERLRLVDLHTYLPGAVLAKVDRMSMRHALEVRTPFFSPAILNLSARLPMRLCAQGGLLKVALRRILARYLPDELIRPAKQGFGMPESFFRAHVRVFERLAAEADEALSEWRPMRDRPASFAKLRQAARSNINSLWAWTVLGQWTTTLGGAQRGT